jgi:hypothetical protein
MDSELSCLIRGRRYHPSLGRVPSPSDDDWLSDQLGIFLLLDRGEESIHIDVKNSPHRNHCSIGSKKEI